MRVTFVIREPGRTKPDYELDFDLPSVPSIGDYISVQRPDTPAPYGEDMIVRQVWWRLSSPETDGAFSGRPPKVGKVDEVFVECQPAIGPYTSDRVRDYLTARREAGEDVPDLDVARLSIRQDALDKS